MIFREITRPLRPLPFLSVALPLFFALIFAACASDDAAPKGPASDPSSSPEASLMGQALDADTGEPIEDAWIFEATPKGTRGADVRLVSDSRWTRTDKEGRYAFAQSASALNVRLGGRAAPRYHFYHPSYGLIRGREARDVPTIFRASLRDSHLRLADLAPYCAPSQRSALDPMATQLAKLSCPPDVQSRFPDGSPRAVGPLDDRGRREGDWIFYRADGSVHARGTYSAGAAIAPWSFDSPSPS